MSGTNTLAYFDSVPKTKSFKLASVCQKNKQKNRVRDKHSSLFSSGLLKKTLNISLSKNIASSWKNLSGANTLAYFDSVSKTKSFKLASVCQKILAQLKKIVREKHISLFCLCDWNKEVFNWHLILQENYRRDKHSSLFSLVPLTKT